MSTLDLSASNTIRLADTPPETGLVMQLSCDVESHRM